MTHITGPLKWTEATMSHYYTTDTQIVLVLSDGTNRFMNLKNWDESATKTHDNLSQIKQGSNIKFATWNGYDSKKWFCDVVLHEDETQHQRKLLGIWTIHPISTNKKIGNIYTTEIPCNHRDKDSTDRVSIKYEIEINSLHNFFKATRFTIIRHAVKGHIMRDYMSEMPKYPLDEMVNRILNEYREAVDKYPIVPTAEKPVAWPSFIPRRDSSLGNLSDILSNDRE